MINCKISPKVSVYLETPHETGIGLYDDTELGLFHLLGHPVEKQKRGSRSQPNPRAPAKESTCENTGRVCGIRDELL